ncbi:MAG: hypothetical protein ACE5FN_01700 [Leptospirillia bacterium]
MDVENGKKSRSGDPFANPTPMPDADALSERPKKRKKGRTFFLFLLFTGGALVIASFVMFFSGKGIIVDFYKDVVVPRGIPEALAPDFPEEKAKHLLRTLSGYFDAAADGDVTDDMAIEMMSRIETALSDQLLTEAEADDLLALAAKSSTRMEGR